MEVQRGHFSDLCEVTEVVPRDLPSTTQDFPDGKVVCRPISYFFTIWVLIQLEPPWQFLFNCPPGPADLVILGVLSDQCGPMLGQFSHSDHYRSPRQPHRLGQQTQRS